MTLNNPDGFDNFTSIQGTHIATYADENVFAVEIYIGKSPIIPSIICQQFAYTFEIVVIGRGLERLTEEALADCYFLDFLRIEDSIVEFHPNSLSNNLFLKSIWISYADIETLPEALLQENSMLRWIYIFGNKHLKEFPELFFENAKNGEVIMVAGNDLQTWHVEWFQLMTKLDELYMWLNSIREIPPYAINSPRLYSLDVSSNSLHDISRQSLGNISGLTEFWMFSNSIEKIDKEVFVDAKSLFTLDVTRNLCVDQHFLNFSLQRESNLELMRDCFGPIIGNDGGKNN